MAILAILILLKFNSNIWADTKFYKHVAISKVLHRNNKLIENNLVIRPYHIKYDPSKSPMSKGSSPIEPEYEAPIWTITPQQLPMNNDICLWADATLCSEDKDDFWRGECIHSCISGGANILAFDENSNKLYLTAESTALGTGGGPFFLFVADVNKKEIKFLKTEYGPFEGDLSPDGKFLVLYGRNYIVIYDTLSNMKYEIVEKNNWDTGHERLHYTYDIHWLSDSQFSYRIGVRHSKFQPSFDEMKENIYDIPSRKIIRTRTLGKQEYDSTPYTEA